MRPQSIKKRPRPSDSRASQRAKRPDRRLKARIRRPRERRMHDEWERVFRAGMGATVVIIGGKALANAASKA